MSQPLPQGSGRGPIVAAITADYLNLAWRQMPRPQFPPTQGLKRRQHADLDNAVATRLDEENATRGLLTQQPGDCFIATAAGRPVAQPGRHTYWKLSVG